MIPTSNPDFCGVETPVSKLSNHFTKQNAVNINTIIPESGIQKQIPNTFDMVSLFNNIQEINDEKSIQKLTNPQLSDQKTYINSPPILNTFHSAPIYNIPTNVPFTKLNENMNSAKEWAHNELSKYEGTVISLEEMNNLMEESKKESLIRFSDVVKQINAEEFKEDQEYENEASDALLYDLDKDLEDLRSKLNSNSNQADIWEKIQKSLEEEKPEQLIYQTNNPYLTEENSKQNCSEILKKGLSLYNRGYFSEALLAFEAVVQLDPKLDVAWHYLGLSYSENEQDNKALIACKKCLELDEKNRDILLSIARIHCNELNVDATIHYLEKWLLSHPHYRNLATVGQEISHEVQDGSFNLWDDSYENFFQSTRRAKIMEQQLIAAKQYFEDISQGNVMSHNFDNAELDVVCGTFYHVMQDYKKAADHFEKATQTLKNQPQLWNKLGTAYCNNCDFEKSIDAYNRALNLAPGFVRAACNKGVAYYNMEKYEDCIRSALTAHKLQNSSSKPIQTNENIETESSPITGIAMNQSNDPIWSLIRLACFKLQRPELDLSVFSRDAETLINIFGLE